MSYLQITNNGLIEPGALTLMGATSKDNDSTKIGQFGSGNKYALAYLLRNNYSFKIYSGEKQIRIETKPEKFRNELFNVIYVDGQKTSITTKMGNDWKLWEAIREIYSNAIDEGNSSINFVEEIQKSKDQTHFYLKVTDSLRDFVDNFDNYFANKDKVLFENNYGRIMEKTGASLNLYRKGIRCYDTQNTSIFDYDLNEIEINENRTVKYSWSPLEEIWKLLFSCTDENIILKVLQECNDNFEGEIGSLVSLYGHRMSKKFKKLVKHFNFAPSEFAGYLKEEERLSTVLLPVKLYNEITSSVGESLSDGTFDISNGKVAYRKTELNGLQKSTLRKALLFFNECGLDIPYEVITGNFITKTILGTIDRKNNLIVISPVCIERGINETVNTIIEEYIHLKHGVSDCTREFQTAAISELITYMKIKNTYVL